MNVESMTNQICKLFESLDEAAIYEQTATKFRIQLRDLLVSELISEGVVNPNKVARLCAASCKVDLTEGFHRDYPTEFGRLVAATAHGLALAVKVIISEFGEEHISTMLNEFAVRFVYE